jgi:hypothetical protein
MADAGNQILNIVATYHNVWARSKDGQPLFEERSPSGYTTVKGDIPWDDRQKLMTQTQFWLAVNGIKDDQVDKLSQPEQSRYEPSIPSFAGLVPSPVLSRNGAGPANTDALDRLKQMVLQGQAPSLDQLKQLLPM